MDVAFWMKIACLAALLIVVYLLSFLIGSVDLSVVTVVDIIRSSFMEVEAYWDGVLEQIVLGVRFPQITLSVLVGGALAVSGASYQTIFKNPMVSSDILGVSAGAGFGAALAMLNGCAWWEIQISAFVCGAGAVLAAYCIGAVFGKQNGDDHPGAGGRGGLELLSGAHLHHQRRSPTPTACSPQHVLADGKFEQG